MNVLPLLLLGSVLAQSGPAMPQHPSPHMMPGAPAPVIPDTAVVELTWPGDAAASLANVRPDSVILGDPVYLEWAGTVPDSLVLPAWLEAAPELAPDGGQGAVLPVRVYRLAPFRLQVGEDLSEVVVVTGRNADPGVVAPVRMPRLPGWAWRTALALLLVALVLAWLGRRLWARRRGPMVWGRDRVPAGAAWPRAVEDLATLLDGLERGGERTFLDGLRRVARAYVSDRFLVHGREMTGGEIEAACVALGYERPQVRRFGRLVDALDHHRYDPAPVSEAWCREQAAAFLAAVAEVRMAPRPDDVAAADVAWRRLSEDLRTATAGGGA